MKPLQLLPAIDIKSGQVIQSKNLSSPDISGSPQQVIDYFVSKGSKWIHLVDLDAAYSTGDNFDLIKNLITAVKVEFQVSGGIT
ncbi:MAG: hypothetical protein RI887_714, partial [Actinomycetota bacterium]